MTTPQVVIEDWQGRHNASGRILEVAKTNAYRDLSTVVVVPTRGTIHATVVQNWMAMMMPMNQKVVRLFVIGMEVGAAYEYAFNHILSDPDLSNYKYVLTLEEDNKPPYDGLLKLFESIDDYDAIGGLYWMKGERGVPMVFGNPESFPINFLPVIPKQDAVTRVNGMGMGFTLFKLEMFKKLERPWFFTRHTYQPGMIMRQTQDLYFFEKAGQAGFKFAVDSRVKTGHYDQESGITW